MPCGWGVKNMNRDKNIFFPFIDDKTLIFERSLSSQITRNKQPLFPY
jgi:hypothetical protein